MENIQIKQEMDDSASTEHAPEARETNFQYQCEFCEFSTKTKKSLRGHLVEKHKDLINDQGDDLSDFVDEEDEEEEEKDDEDEESETESETEETEELPETDLDKVELEKRTLVICPVCHEECDSKANFLTHTANVHLKLKLCDYQCCICSLKFGRRHFLKVHIMTVHKFDPGQTDDLIKEQLKDIASLDTNDEIRENDALTERSCEYWPGASEYTGGRKRKMKEEPDFYAPFEPEVIVNYPQDGMDDDEDQDYYEPEKKRKRTRKQGARTRNSYKDDDEDVDIKTEFAKIVPCPVCGTERPEDKLEIHLRNTHTAEEAQACDMCPKIFINKALLRNHELKIHKKHTAPHTCPRCDESFKNKVTLKDHMKKVHNEKYEIETVNRAMKRGDSDPNEPRAPYICEQCGQSYSRRDTLRNHIKKRHSGIPEGDFFCPECPRRFFAKRELNNHLRTTHDKSPTEPCSICHKGYTPQQMKRHLRLTHSAEISQQCDICHSILHNRRSLEIHRFSVHINTEPKMVCPRCGKKFKEKRALEMHIRHTHDKLRPFICELCGRGFEGAGRMKKHIQVVHLKIQRELRHVCDQCDYKAKDLHLLVKHKVRLHGLEKSFHCDKCPKSYAVRSQLTEHIRVFHEGIMIKCSDCDREFTNTNTMYKHKRVVHTHEKPHKCNQCGMSFSMEQYLMKHLRATHKIPPELLEYPLKQFSVN